MNHPTGIDEATWAKALTNASLWRAGQRCDACPRLEHLVADHYEPVQHPHDIPPPAVTPALLWEMLTTLALRRGDYALDIFANSGPIHFDKHALAAAVIRAMAAFKE